MGKTTFTLLTLLFFYIHTTYAKELPNENILITITEQTGFICDDGTGSIIVEASEGTAPYMYSIDGGATQSTGAFTDITPGLHTITVQDAGACTATLDIFIENACVALIKTGEFNDENNDGITQAGETILYTFMVINSGNVVLSNLDVVDPLVEVIGDPIDLEPSETDSTTFTAIYVVTVEDVEVCQVINQATTKVKTTSGQPITDLSDDDSFDEDDPTIVELPKNLSTESVTLENNITIYPNPATDIVTISNPTAIQLESFLIHDTQGRIVKKSFSTSESIDISSLQNGIYFITIKSLEGAITKQLIVTN